MSAKQNLSLALVAILAFSTVFAAVALTDDSNAESDIDFEYLADHYYHYDDIVDGVLAVGASIGDTLIIEFPDNITIKDAFGIKFIDDDPLAFRTLYLNISTVHNVVHYQFPVFDSELFQAAYGVIEYYDDSGEINVVSFLFELNNYLSINVDDLDTESTFSTLENTRVAISIYRQDGNFWSIDPDTIPVWMDNISEQWYQGIIDSGEYTIVAISYDESITKTIHIVAEPFVVWDPFGDLANPEPNPDNNNTDTPVDYFGPILIFAILAVVFGIATFANRYAVIPAIVCTIIAAILAYLGGSA